MVILSAGRNPSQNDFLILEDSLRHTSLTHTRQMSATAEASSSSAPVSTQPKPPQYCFAFFGRGRSCLKGDTCSFSHDVEQYKTLKQLKDCPSNCGNFCLV